MVGLTSLVSSIKNKVISLGWRNQNPNKMITTTAPPPWIELPDEITTNILQRLNSIEILTSAQYVCTSWHKLCKDPIMWRVIDMKYRGSDNYKSPYNLENMCLHAVDRSNNYKPPYNVKNMCHHAVDRSQGQLIGIKIVHCTDELLRYICERSSQLRCLTLAMCNDVSEEGLTEAISKFPNLEELHLIFTIITPPAIKSIGILCPNLKSFTFNMVFPLGPQVKENGYAYAIAMNMHGLRHLNLFGNHMTNSGVRAILDDCPNLESLDLRHCFNTNLLHEKLGERCAQQIRDFRGPSSSCKDYEWIELTSTVAWISSKIFDPRTMPPIDDMNVAYNEADEQFYVYL